MSNTQKILSEQAQGCIQEVQNAQKYSFRKINELGQQKNQNFYSQTKNDHKAQDLIGLITHQIQSEIQKSQTSVSDEKKPFSLIDKNKSILLKNESEKIDQKKITEFVKKRNDLEEQIRRLKMEQEQQKHKSRSKSPKQELSSKTFRSNFTPKEQMEISRIIKKSEKFQQQLLSKNKQLAQNVQIQRKIRQKQHMLCLEKLKERKKEQAFQKIKQMQKQRRQRIQRLKVENKKFQQLKKTKVLHQKIEEHDELFQEKKRQKQMQLLRQKRQSMTFNFEEIKNHQKKYYQTVRMSKQKLQNQLTQKNLKMKQQDKFLSQTYRPSKFLLTLWSEQKKKQQQQRQRIEQMKSLYNKKNNFQEKLREMHKEKIRTRPKMQMKKSMIDEKLQNHRLKVKSMSAADIYKQGQQYMKSVHSSISPVLIEQSKVQLQNNHISIKNGTRIQYRDYLQETKIRKELLYKSTGKLNTRHNPQINELEHLIGNKNQNPNRQLQKAKLIAQKLDQKAKNLSTAALIDSVSAKLRIIEEFS